MGFQGVERPLQGNRKGTDVNLPTTEGKVYGMGLSSICPLNIIGGRIGTGEMWPAEQESLVLVPSLSFNVWFRILFVA